MHSPIQSAVALNPGTDLLLPSLFTIHFLITGIMGPLTLIFPSSFEVLFFSLPHSEFDRSLLRVVVQLYGIVLAGQSALVYCLNQYLFTFNGKSAPLTHNLCKNILIIFSAVFLISFGFMMKGQIQGHFNLLAIVHSMIFLTFGMAYAFFASRLFLKGQKRVRI